MSFQYSLHIDMWVINTPFKVYIWVINTPFKVDMWVSNTPFTKDINTPYLILYVSQQYSFYKRYVSLQYSTHNGHVCPLYLIPEAWSETHLTLMRSYKYYFTCTVRKWKEENTMQIPCNCCYSCCFSYQYLCLFSTSGKNAYTSFGFCLTHAS